MKTGNNRVVAFASIAASVLLVLGTFMAVWLMPREAGSASAQNSVATSEKPTHITVRGTGFIPAKPNTLVMNVGVSIQEPAVKTAQDKVSVVVAAMVDRLKAAGVADADYRTAQYNVETVMDFDGKSGAAQRVTGFRVVNVLEITFRDAARAPQVLDELVAAGANTVYSAGYTYSDLPTLQKQAYEKAVQDAEERATRLASLSGLTLGKIVSVTEASASVPGISYDKVGMGAGGGAFYPGQGNVGTDVIVTYEAK